MKKSDLKDFMLVQLRDGDVYIVLKGNLYGNCEWTGLMSTLNEDLTATTRDYDIVKVSTSLRGTDLIPCKWDSITLGRNLLWYRTEETIEIGGVKYDKHEFEEAVKDLKPVTV